jgi:hypothetical protein
LDIEYAKAHEIKDLEDDLKSYEIKSNDSNAYSLLKSFSLEPGLKYAYDSFQMSVIKMFNIESRFNKRIDTL